MGEIRGKQGSADEQASEQEDRAWQAAREAAARCIERYGIKDERVLNAVRKVRRHLFIPESHRSNAAPYGDHPCAIGYGQTISQPYIVAYMTWRLQLCPGERVLEIGTGSGYQAALLAELGADVYSVETVPELAEHARRTLRAEGYEAVHVRVGDGYAGWPEHAPYDAAIVTCAPPAVPPALVEQLADGGRMIAPVGVGGQRLVLLRKEAGKVREEDDLLVRFVPMVHGRA